MTLPTQLPFVFDRAHYLALKNEAANTIVTYRYVSGSNLKALKQVILAGVVSEESINQMAMSLFDGDHFLPQQLGLPCASPATDSKDWDADHDHQAHQLLHIGLTYDSANFEETAAWLEQQLADLNGPDTWDLARYGAVWRGMARYG